MIFYLDLARERIGGGAGLSGVRKLFSLFVLLGKGTDPFIIRSVITHYVETSTGARIFRNFVNEG
jgi:hypothetical protein